MFPHPTERATHVLLISNLQRCTHPLYLITPSWKYINNKQNICCRYSILLHRVHSRVSKLKRQGKHPYLEPEQIYILKIKTVIFVRLFILCDWDLLLMLRQRHEATAVTLLSPVILPDLSDRQRDSSLLKSFCLPDFEVLVRLIESWIPPNNDISPHPWCKTAGEIFIWIRKHHESVKGIVHSALRTYMYQMCLTVSHRGNFMHMFSVFHQCPFSPKPSGPAWFALVGQRLLWAMEDRLTFGTHGHRWPGPLLALRYANGSSDQ